MDSVELLELNFTCTYLCMLMTFEKVGVFEWCYLSTNFLKLIYNDSCVYINIHFNIFIHHSLKNERTSVQSYMYMCKYLLKFFTHFRILIMIRMNILTFIILFFFQILVNSLNNKNWDINMKIALFHLLSTISSGAVCMNVTKWHIIEFRRDSVTPDITL